MFNLFKNKNLVEEVGGEEKIEQQTLLFFGRSGSGKGTQIKLLMEFLQKRNPSRRMYYIETGNFVRDLAKTDSYSGRRTKEIIESGGLLPEFVPILLWGRGMIDNLTGDEHLITDGLSRRILEAGILVSALSFFKRQNPKVIYINVSREWATNRLINRGRKDDSATGVTSRMDWFEDSVISVLDYFRNQEGYQFIEINGEQAIPDVQNEILAKLGLNL